MAQTRVDCPYCGARLRGRAALRDHVAGNLCGKVPADVALAYDPAEAKAETEQQFLAMVMRYAKGQGWRRFHVERSRVRPGQWVTNTQGDPGVPDLWLVRDGVLVVIEFKAIGGRDRPGQADWIADLDRVPGVTALMGVTPRDWPAIQALLGAHPGTRTGV